MVGIAYTLFARAMYRQQLAALQREMLREHGVVPGFVAPASSTPRYRKNALRTFLAVVVNLLRLRAFCLYVSVPAGWPLCPQLS